MRSNQIAQMIKDLPLAQRIVAASGLVVLALAGVVFYQWVSTPTYSILYSGLDDQTLNEVITGLESQGVDYKLEAAGSQVLVPQADVYRARAALAADGVAARVSEHAAGVGERSVPRIARHRPDFLGRGTRAEELLAQATQHELRIARRRAAVEEHGVVGLERPLGRRVPRTSAHDSTSVRPPDT